MKECRYKECLKRKKIDFDLSKQEAKWFDEDKSHIGYSFSKRVRRMFFEASLPVNTNLSKGKECCLCGRKKATKGIAIIDSIRKNRKGEITEYNGPENLIWFCDKCHYKAWSMWFEMFDAIANGYVKQLLRGGFDYVLEHLTPEKLHKRIINQYNTQKGNN